MKALLGQKAEVSGKRRQRLEKAVHVVLMFTALVPVVLFLFQLWFMQKP